MCVCVCSVSDALMKALSQEPQLNGRSPRCCRSWSFRWDLCLKAFSHIWHALPQTTQRWGLKPEWIFRCSLRWAAVVKALGQCSQPYGRLAVSSRSFLALWSMGFAPVLWQEPWSRWPYSKYSSFMSLEEEEPQPWL
uniref:Uncharacterized protein n=1 Tax=Seriola dumerili TaxID=41447 RepID=A0A3B4U268_SERDU